MVYLVIADFDGELSILNSQNLNLQFTPPNNTCPEISGHVLLSIQHLIFQLHLKT